MSAAVETYRDDLEASYAVDFSRDREPTKKRARFPEYKRRGAAPSRVSGMHCRRNKRWTWGSGRGARVLNMRAFTGAIAFTIASVASSVLAVPLTLNLVTVGSPGNTGINVPQPQLSNTIRPNTGAVADIFKIGRYETTNSEYAAFLNAVDPTGANPSLIFDASMASDTVNGGINSFVSGTGYSVKDGFADKPVTYVSWFSAARFVNWLAGGQQTGSSGQSDMQGGFAGSAYTLTTSQTSGAIVARNPGATFFLPSLDEFYKAAYYNSANQTYWTYPTASNTLPTDSVQISDQALINVANFGANTTGVVDVDFYTNAQSAYGLFGAFGNVVEMTDSVNPSNSSQVMGGGGSWKMAISNAPNWSGAQIRYINVGVPSDALGFRVAAVPEPSTMVLAGGGLAGLAGLGLRRRRAVR